MAKISSFIVGLMTVSLIVSLLMIFISYGVNNKDIPMDNQNLQSYKDLNATFNQTSALLTKQSEEIKTNTSTIQTQTGITDILGNMFSGGYQVLLITFGSLNIFEDMVAEAFKQLGLGEAGVLILKMIIPIVVILLFLGVIIAAIVKWRV